MVENKLEQEIIQLYDSNLVNLFSIHQISKKLNKTYPYINKKVTSLVQEGILKKIVVGRSYLCSLNMDNDKTVLLLSLNEINKKKNVNTKDIEVFITKNSLELSIHSVVKSNKNIIFIVNDLRDRRKIMRKFDDCLVVDKQEFIDMLFDSPKLFKKHVVVYGYERFFELIRASYLELKNEYSPLRY